MSKRKRKFTSLESENHRGVWYVMLQMKEDDENKIGEQNSLRSGTTRRRGKENYENVSFVEETY